MRHQEIRSIFTALVLLFSLPGLLLSCATGQPPGADLPVSDSGGDLETLVILGTNDIHGSLVADRLKSRESDGVSPIEYEAGGVANLAAYVNVLRDRFGSRLLWLDGGDQFQGTLESNLEKGKGMVKVFNLSTLGAAAVGNHEFDYGPEHSEGEGSDDVLGALKARMSEANYSYLAANIMDQASGELARFPNTFPSRIFRAGRLNVGVIGLSTLETPKTTRSHFVRSLRFADLKESTLREAAALRKQGAHLVVITAHVGLRCQPGRVPTNHLVRKVTDPQGECGTTDEMVEFLRSLPGGTVDAVVSGHSHQIVHHWVAGVPVIQGGSLARYFNLIYLTYDLKEGKLVSDRTRIEGPVPVCPKTFAHQGDCNGDRPAPKNGRGKLVETRFHGKPIQTSSEVLALLKPTLDKAAEAKKSVVAEAARPIEMDRYNESPLGNLVADAVHAAAGSDVALVNPGGIRAPLEQGTITYGNVFRVLPFDNGIVTLKVTGKELMTILRIGLSGSRGFTPTSGLRLRVIGQGYDAPGDDLDGDGKVAPWEVNRIIEARLADGAPIRPEKLYTLATIDFLVTGGDDVGWAMQKIPGDRQIHSNSLLREAAVDHLKRLFAQSGPLNSEKAPLLDTANPRMKFEKAPSGKSKSPKKRSRKKRRS